MNKYKTKYNEWFEALSPEEKNQEKERTSQKSSKKSAGASIPLATATNSIIAGAVNSAGAGAGQALSQAVAAATAPVQLPTQPIYTQLPTNLQPLPPPGQHQAAVAMPGQQLQNIQMPITVPYPNMSAGGGAATPMLVKVEVVGAPGTQSHVTHAQIMPQMTYSALQPQNYAPQVSYATQPFTMQVAPQPAPVVTQAASAAPATAPPLTMAVAAPAPSTTSSPKPWSSICVTDLPTPTQNLTVSPRRQEIRRQQQRRRQELLEQEQRRAEVDLSLFPSLVDEKERHVPKEIPHHPSIPFPKDPRNPLKTAVEKLKLKVIKKY